MDCGSLFILLVVGGLALIVVLGLLYSSNQPQQSRGGAGAQAAPSDRRTTASHRTMHLTFDLDSFRTPPASRRRALSRDGDRFWIPAGERCSIHVYEIDGGMIYVGSGLAGVAEWGPDVEAALVDPKLPVARSVASPSEEMGYWPTYERISPADRAVYLDWLQNGRQNPNVGIGYVFLFFYGLERRLLADTRTSERAREEIDGLLAEVERLLSIYGSHHSFGRYARSLLDTGRSVHGRFDPARFEPPLERQSYGLPVSTRLALGRFVARGEPIPAEWALSWLVGSEGTYLHRRARVRSITHVRRDVVCDDTELGLIQWELPERGPARLGIHERACGCVRAV